MIEFNVGDKVFIADNAKCHEGTDGSCDGWVDKRVFNKLGVISEPVDSDGDYCVHCDGLDQWIAGEFLTLHARTEVEIHVGDRVKRTTFNDDGTVKSIVEAVAQHQNQGWWFSEDSLPLYSPEDSNSTTTFEIVEAAIVRPTATVIRLKSNGTLYLHSAEGRRYYSQYGESYGEAEFDMSNVEVVVE